MIITFSGQEFLLHHSGVLYWPSRKMLIVSDLHLEKGSHFARRGFFLPPYDSQETLKRLHTVIDEIAPEKIILLGDCFHDVHGHARLGGKERTLFERLLDFSPIWIHGNHDGDFVPDGFTAFHEYEQDGIFFRHQATHDPLPEISGHYHPKAEIVHKGAKIARACFLEDGNKMMLPAFGAYTGGLLASHPSITEFMTENPNIYMMTSRKCIKI